MLRAADDVYALQASVLRTLASPRRLEIIHLLDRGPVEVHRLAEELGIGQPNVSAHLAALRSIGFVEPVRDGRNVRYRLTDEAIVPAFDMVREVLARRLERLAVSVAATQDAAETEPHAGAAELLGVGER